MRESRSCAASPPESGFPDVPGYRLRRLVGAGGMGSVYEAERLVTRECFAVKVISGHLASDPDGVLRFRREVKALRDIRHPNVVEIFDWYLPPRGDARRPFIVMELLPGETLAALLKRERCLSPSRAAAIMLQVLDGLAAAHRVGVLHRDLGPANVFLVPRPNGGTRVKLLDFGLARPIVGDDSVDTVTQRGTFLGKPAYAAPELFQELPLGPPSDVFSAGLLLYRMLAGRLPHEAVSGEMLWVERLGDRRSVADYPSPSKFAPHLPKALAELVSHAVRKRVGERIQTAGEFQRRLLALDLPAADDAAAADVRRGIVESDDDPPSVEEPVDSASAARAAQARGRRLLPLAAGLTATAAALVILAFTFGVVLRHGGRTSWSGGSSPGRLDGPAAAASPSRLEAPDPVPARPAPRDCGLPAGATPPAGPVTRSPAIVGPLPAIEALPPTGGGGTANAPGERWVRMTFVDLPRRAIAFVGGRRADAAGVVLVPWSEEPTEVLVDAPGSGYRTYVGRVLPDRDRFIRPFAHRRGGSRAARPAPPAVVRDAALRENAPLPD
ncbi:MAG: protein kinase [Deltaproteobacteria bacterium]|nr:protein kinase [Deltaproteobacteria bacterium]